MSVRDVKTMNSIGIALDSSSKLALQREKRSRASPFGELLTQKQIRHKTSFVMDRSSSVEQISQINMSEAFGMRSVKQLDSP